MEFAGFWSKLAKEQKEKLEGQLNQELKDKLAKLKLPANEKEIEKANDGYLNDNKAKIECVHEGIKVSQRFQFQKGSELAKKANKLAIEAIKQDPDSQGKVREARNLFRRLEKIDKEAAKEFKKEAEKIFTYCPDFKAE